MLIQLKRDSWQFKLFAYMLSQGITLLGSTIVSFAVIWHVTLNTGSGIAVAGITITTYLPQALIMLYGGVLADRYPPKRIIILADSFVALSTLILAILFIFEIKHIGLLLLFNSLRSFGTGIQLPSIKSMLPILVPGNEFMRANSIYTSIWFVIQLIAPGLCGIIMRFLSMTGIFLIDVFSALIGVLLLCVISMPARESREGGYHPLSELKSGARYILTSRSLKNSIVFYSVFSFLVVPASQLTPLLASQTFGDEVWILSAIETAFSIGALLASLLMIYKKFKTAPFKLIGFSAMLFGFVMISLVFSKNIILFVALMLVMGIGSPLYYTPLTTHIQEITKKEYIGRTFSFVDLFASLAIPLGMLLFGPLSEMSIMLPFLIPGVLLILLGIKAKKINCSTVKPENLAITDISRNTEK